MKQKNLSIVLLFIGSFFIVSHTSAKIEFKTEQLSYKATFEDTEFNASFEFTNTGETEITVLDVKSTCGCTVASLDKKIYAPGESGAIQALFTFGQRSGVQHKTIHAETSEGDFNLQIEVDIPKPYELSKALLTWGKEEIGTSKSTELTVNELTPVKIAEVQFMNDFLDYEVLEKTVGSVFEIIFTPKEGFGENNRPVRVVLKIERKDGSIKEAAVYIRASNR